jgi:hypothetical protein
MTNVLPLPRGTTHVLNWYEVFGTRRLLRAGRLDRGRNAVALASIREQQIGQMGG